jgi:hypothetical protein
MKHHRKNPSSHHHPPTQSLIQILPTIAEDAKHPAFGDVPEAHLHQPITASTTAAESSHNNATTSQATTGAPHQSFPRAPTPEDTEPDHIQIDDWDDEVEEETIAAEEEELARVQ